MVPDSVALTYRGVPTPTQVIRLTCDIVWLAPRRSTNTRDIPVLRLMHVERSNSALTSEDPDPACPEVSLGCSRRMTARH